MTRPLSRTAAKRLRRFLAQRLSIEDFALADDTLNRALAWALVVGQNSPKVDVDCVARAYRNLNVRAGDGDANTPANGEPEDWERDWAIEFAFEYDLVAASDGAA